MILMKILTVKTAVPISIALILIIIFFVYQQNDRVDEKDRAVVSSRTGLDQLAVEQQEPDHRDNIQNTISSTSVDRKSRPAVDDTSRLLAEAVSIEDYGEREAYLMALGDAFAADRERIITLLGQITRIEDQALFIDSVIQSLFEQNPEDAASLVSQMEHGGLKDSGLAKITSLWLDRQEPVTAAYWCEQIYQPMERGKLIHPIAEQWAKQDPEAAYEWLSSMVNSNPM